MTIEEGNRLIAEFMGASLKEEDGRWYGTHWTPHRGLHESCSSQDKLFVENEIYTRHNFHKSWDWLMPVVDTIESLGERPYLEDQYLFYGLYEGLWYAGFEEKFAHEDYKKYYGEEAKKCKSKILAVWQACINFIKWYNENTSTVQPQ